MVVRGGGEPRGAESEYVREKQQTNTGMGIEEGWGDARSSNAKSLGKDAHLKSPLVESRLE